MRNAACEDRVLDGPASGDKGPYPEYSRANSYPWSPFPSGQREGAGPHEDCGLACRVAYRRECSI